MPQPELRMHHPDVGLPVVAQVRLAIDVQRREPFGKTYSPDSGKAISVHDSQSVTLPVMCSERGSGVATRAPSRSWTRIHGSSSSPSSRRQVT